MIGIGVKIIPFISKVARAAADYYNRITADGGVSESPDCVNSEMSDLDRQNLLNNASLLLIPSGYKEDVVYSQIPTSGAGDLTFTRASNGTRINSAGLVEVCPWNLVQYSEDFSNGVWATYGTGTITTNTTTAPNGTTTADKFTPNTTNTTHACEQNMGTTSGAIIMSLYAKADGYNWLCFNSYVGGFKLTWFNISTGTIGTVASGVSASIESVGNGWYRCIVSLTGGASTYFSIIPTNANNVSSFAGDGTSGIFIWGAQLNIGSTAKPYFPTTDRLNVPRLTYQNGGGGCPSLLLEKQSTNLITYSEDISNSFATQFQVTITSNNTTSPDGTQNADLLKFDSTTSYILRNQTVNASTAYTMSVFVKNNNFTSGQQLTFNMSDGVIGGLTAQINVVAKTATFSAASGAFTSVSGKVEDYENGWFRVSVTGTSVSGGGGWYEMAASNVTNSCFVWGLSLEISAYATSYIPTTTSSATRVADACFKTGIGSLIGSTSGAMFMDINNPNPSQYLGTPPANTIFGSINSGDYQNNFHFTTYDVNIYLYCNASGGALQAAIGTTMPTTSKIKMAVTYTNSAIKFFLNGVLVGTDTSFTLPSSMSRVDIGHMGGQPDSQRMRGSVNEFLLFTTALTDAEAIALTTL